jgi:hypothetical protein
VPTVISPLPTPVSPLPTPKPTQAAGYPWGWWGDKAGFRFDGRDIIVAGGGAILASDYLYIDQAAAMTVKQIDPTSGELGLVLLSLNSAAADGDMIKVSFSAREGLLRVWARAGDAWWPMGDVVPVSLTPGARVRAVLNDDMLTVTIDGRHVGTWYMEPWRFDPSAGGWAGLVSDNAKHVVTDFEVEQLP